MKLISESKKKLAWIISLVIFCTLFVLDTQNFGKLFEASLSIRRVKSAYSFNDLIGDIISKKKITWSEVPLNVQKALLQKAAEELDIEVAELSTTVLTATHFKFLGGAVLGTFCRYWANNLTYGKIDASVLPLQLQGLITQEEINSCKNAMQLIMRILGIPEIKKYEALNDVIAALSVENEFINWEAVPLDWHTALLSAAAEELGMSVNEIIPYDMKEHCFDFINGQKLTRLYDYYIRLFNRAKESFDSLPERIKERVNKEEIGGLNSIQFMKYILKISYKDEDAKYETVDDVIKALSASESVNWDNVSLKIQKELIKRAAAELKIGIGEIGIMDLDRTKFTFLEEATLHTLVQFYNVNLNYAKLGLELLSPSLRGLINEEEVRSCKNTLDFMRKILNITPVQEERYYSDIDVLMGDLSRGEPVDWQRVTLNMQVELLEKLAEGWGLDIQGVLSEMSRRSTIFLDSRTLLSVYSYYEQLLTAGKADFESLPERVASKLTPEDIQALSTVDLIRITLQISLIDGAREYKTAEDVISAICAPGEIIDWDKVPLDIHRELLTMASQELGIGISELRAGQLIDTKFKFLQGNSLIGLVHSYTKHLSYGKDDFNLLPERIRNIIIPVDFANIRNVTQFMKKVLGIPLSENEVAYETVDGIIGILSSPDSRIIWDRVSFAIQLAVLNRAASELDMSLNKMLNDEKLGSKFSFLEGNTLDSLVRYYRQILNKAKTNFNDLPERIRLKLKDANLDKMNYVDLMKLILDINF